MIRTNPDQALAFLRTGTGPAEGIDIAARNGLETDALAAMERGRIGLDKQVEGDRQRFLSDLTIGVDRGTKGYADVEGAYARGVIEPTERTRLIKQLDDKRKTDAEAAAGIARVSAALSGGAPLDFRNADDRKALDSHFALTSAGWKDLPTAEVVDRAVAYTTQVGIAPKPVQGMIRGFLRSGNAEQASLAASTVKRLREANPQILNDFADEDLRLANVVGALTDSGVPPARALTLAQDQMKVSKQEIEVRGEEYDVQRGADRTARLASDRAWIEDRKNWVIFSDPDVDPMMRSDFDTIARQEFLRTGNLEASRTFALDQVDRVWGRSTVGGTERYMKFAPEKFYGMPRKSQSENSAWMTEQLLLDVFNSKQIQDAIAKRAADVKEARKLGFTDHERRPFRDMPLVDFYAGLLGGEGYERVGQIADALQRRFGDDKLPKARDLLVLPEPGKSAPDGRPRYLVSILNADGAYEALLGADGRPARWAPNWDSSPAAARQRAEFDQLRAIGRENVERARMLDNLRDNPEAPRPNEPPRPLPRDTSPPPADVPAQTVPFSTILDAVIIRERPLGSVGEYMKQQREK